MFWRAKNSHCADDVIVAKTETGCCNNDQLKTDVNVIYSRGETLKVIVVFQSEICFSLHRRC